MKSKRIKPARMHPDHKRQRKVKILHKSLYLARSIKLSAMLAQEIQL